LNKIRNIEKLVDKGLVAVIRKPSKKNIIKIAESLIEGGVGALEITVESNGAFEIIEELKCLFGDRVLVGAGTVLDPQTAKTAIDAGSDFVFSPS
jgi:2-dehydro-3-deoxyphosphogluconate aldolase/(4S)-4-hydroxy-2-oxoglutarate aldolase